MKALSEPSLIHASESADSTTRGQPAMTTPQPRPPLAALAVALALSLAACGGGGG
jgi:hypothetical protein